MTICYPQIITARICPRSELNFSLTPPTCVRVVPVYNDASYVISQFPPPVHFLVRDNGQVYQLADIQSPPSTPPEYHAILDSTGCILIGVELSAVTTVPLTNAQVSVLPGVLRYVLQTLGLPLTSVINTLPPQRCRPQLWQQILAATQECLNTPPPPPPPPPGLTCSFVLSCISPGQNINISTGGIISAGQLVPGPGDGQYTWLSPNGTPLFTFSASGGIPLTVQDTPTVDLTLTAGNVLSADVRVSTQPGNVIQILPDGLFVGATSINLSVQDTPTVDLTLSAGNVLSANVNISGQPNNQLQVLPDGLYIASTSGPCLNNPPNLVNFPTIGLSVIYNPNTGCLEQIVIPPERVVYGEPNGAGSPRADNLRYSPALNFVRATVGPDFSMQHSFMLYGPNVNVNGVFYSVIGAITNSNLFNSSVSFVNVFRSSTIAATNSVVVGQDILTASSVSESALLSRNSSVSTASHSFVTSGSASINSAAFSFVSAGFGVSHPFAIFASLSIALSSQAQPAVSFSSYIARETSINAGTPIVAFSNATPDFVRFDGGVQVYQSTLHLSDSTLRDVGSGNRFAFISGEAVTLDSIQHSFFSSQINSNQSISSHHSFVSMQAQVGNRVGPATPFIRGSVVITADTLPDSSNTLFISEEPNRWFSLRESVYVARGVTVYDSNPPNNTAFLNNSLIVGQLLDVSSTISVNALTLVGIRLSAGRDTVFGVGFNSYTPPPVLAAGGWLAYIADGGTDNANYFQGWASAWRFRLFNPAINYPNEVAATAALNAAYGTDPRNDIGTMVVVRVAGRPAIFSWDGATFTRITT